MKKLLAISALFAVSLFAACSSSDDDAATPTPTPTPSPYFIEGKIDGVMYHADYVCPYTGCAMSTGNFDEFMEWITMQRTMSATNPIGWDILITQVKLDSWTVPDTLDASSFFDNENLQLSFYMCPTVR